MRNSFLFLNDEFYFFLSQIKLKLGQGSKLRASERHKMVKLGQGSREGWLYINELL
jgi:hypothetical protein